ncbi:MAG: hypothetical protein II770_03300 [Bacteroidales bacterium]|jgi:hypothetical protein|nr:hypothetical protein [Bacteroidales bacterium]
MGKISTRSLRRIKTIEDLDIASARVRLELARRSDAVSENVEGIRSLFRPVNLFAQGLNLVSRRTPLAQMLLGGVRQLKARLTK